MISISLEGVTKRFGTTTALDGIDLRVSPGEIFFLLGPSGCGKTTLLRSIAGFHTPDAGRILFDTEDVSHLPPHRRETGMMFQSYALWPHLTVAGNVAFGLEERRLPRSEIQKRVEEALASVQMQVFGDRKIHQLSGGQQQRVALARALVIRPRCLLLDEPLSNLDAKLRMEMRSEIRRICREARLTAIYVTHDQKEALSIADRMAVLENGRIRQAGSPAELYRHPRSRFVADFMGETNFLAARVINQRDGVAQVEGPWGVLSASADGLELQAGDEVTLSVRPEAWRLSTRPAEANTIAGRIRDRIYLGEVAQYRFAISSAPALTLKISELNPQFVDASPERELYASVASADIVLLRS